MAGGHMRGIWLSCLGPTTGNHGPKRYVHVAIHIHDALRRKPVKFKFFMERLSSIVSEESVAISTNYWPEISETHLDHMSAICWSSVGRNIGLQSVDSRPSFGEISLCKKKPFLSPSHPIYDVFVLPTKRWILELLNLLHNASNEVTTATSSLNNELSTSPADSFYKPRTWTNRNVYPL